MIFFQVQRLGVHRTLRGRGCLASARYFQAGEGEGPGRMDGTTSGNFCNISVIFFLCLFSMRRSRFHEILNRFKSKNNNRKEFPPFLTYGMMGIVPSLV